MLRQKEELRCGCEPSAWSSAALLQSTQRLSCQHESLSSGWNIQGLLQKYLQQLPVVSRHLRPSKKHPASPAHLPNSHRPLTNIKYAQCSSFLKWECDALTDGCKNANFKDANLTRQCRRTCQRSFYYFAMCWDKVVKNHCQTVIVQCTNSHCGDLSNYY